MKKVFSTIVLMTMLAITGLFAQTSSIEWKTKSHDFGTIKRGIPVTAVFEFTNNADSSVVIADVVTSCGCTKGEYTKGPVAKGKSAKFEAIFNAANVGSFSKSVTVKFSNQESVILNISGTVEQ